MKRLLLSNLLILICGFAMSAICPLALSEIVERQASEIILLLNGPTVENVSTETATAPIEETLLPSHFVWGASMGSSIDMTGQDMTAVDIDACFGYRNRFFKIIGFGAGIKMMMSNSSRCYPIFAIIRTSFTTRPSFCFFEVKGGLSLNNLYTDIFQRRPYGSGGIGFVLAHGKTFSSQITLTYECMPLTRAEVDAVSPLHTIHYAALRIGATF